MFLGWVRIEWLTQEIWRRRKARRSETPAETIYFKRKDVRKINKSKENMLNLLLKVLSIYFLFTYEPKQ